MTFRLGDLIADLGEVRVRGDRGAEVREVRDDSRQVSPGDLFVALPGTQVDGRRFLQDALARGAAVVVSEAAPGLDELAGVTVVIVPDARRALAAIAARRFHSGRELALTAVTGTSGKTTTTYLIESMLQAAGRTPGVLGTVAYRYQGRDLPSSLTTPGAVELHRLLAEMRAAGCSDAVLEASSHALDQARLAGCRFQAAALTNVTQDHLDYHGDLDRYFAAKAILFRELMAPDGTSVLFVDREDGRRMRREAQGRTLSVTLARTGADVTVREQRMDAQGVWATLDTPMGAVEIQSPLVGEFNLANLVLATGVAVALGLRPEAIAAGASSLRGVPGRLEAVPNDAGVLCVVDYAHKPDALERVLQVLRPLTRGRLITVFGCGGDRDRSKRSIMGDIAARLSDLVVVTSDNPRTEDPQSILEMILEGVRPEGLPLLRADQLGAARGVHVQVDRRLAIAGAVGCAGPGDTLLIAGKGHEDYQILGTTKIHFDDREEAANAFAARVSGRPS